MLGVQEERSHMSLRGERHVYVIVMICFALIFFPMFSHYPIQDSGGERLLEKEICEFIAYLYLWEHVYT